MTICGFKRVEKNEGQQARAGNDSPSPLMPHPLVYRAAGDLAVGISLGWIHTCAAMNGGGVKCWGYNDIGQVGDGTFVQRNLPVNVLFSVGTWISLRVACDRICTYASCIRWYTHRHAHIHTPTPTLTLHYTTLY